MVELTGLESLARIVDPVAGRFVEAGHRIFLVGGVVRDLVLTADGPPGTTDNDIDLTTDAPPADIKLLLSPLADALWTQGERFGTIGAMVGGKSLEITTHRAEAYDPRSRKPVVTFGRNLDEDLSRRDFTVNAMAIELPDRTLHDPYGGMDDLAAGILRTPLRPEVSFGDDPLRIMRAARFVSRFGLSPTPELVTAAGQLSGRLEIVSVERVADELERLLAVDDPSAGLRFLADTGALGHIVIDYRSDDALATDGAAGEDPARSADLAERVRLAVDLAGADLGPASIAGRADGDPVVRRAGLLWPLGHRASAALSRLRYSNFDRTRTVGLIEATDAGLQPDLDRAAVRRIVANVGLDDLALVSSLAANVARCVPAIGSDHFDRLEGLLAALHGDEDLTDLQAPLSGTEIIDVLGLEPGPAVGRAQRFLLEHRLDNGPYSPEEARELLLSWWHEAGDGD